MRGFEQDAGAFNGIVGDNGIEFLGSKLAGRGALITAGLNVDPQVLKDASYESNRSVFLAE
jgi:hypothetical protein